MNPTPKGRIRKSSKQKVENSHFEEYLTPVATMTDNRTMAEMLRAPTEGCAEAIVVPPILAEQFKLKHSLINMMTSEQFFGLEKDNPHDHIRWGSPSVARKKPPRSITTWDDLDSKFINEFFPPSRTTNLRNEISNFQQKFDESFHKAWERYKDLRRACPHHGFTELHQLDTFYNALNPADQDSLNAAAGGNLLEKSPQDALTIIENKSKVRNSQSKPIASPVNACDNHSSSEIAKLTHAVNQQTSVVTTAMTAMLKQLQSNPPLAQVKAVEEICVTCGGAYPYYQCLTAGGNTFPEFRDNSQGYISAAAGNYNQGNPGYRPQGAARRWLEKEPPRSITTWDYLVSKFINEFFPPSRTTNLRNEIANFQQKFDESFHEAWERYKDLLRACPHHGFNELHQLDTFYNALNPADQDSLSAAAGGNLLEKSPQDALTIIENKSKVRNSRSKPIASSVNACDNHSSSELAKLRHAVNQQTSVMTLELANRAICTPDGIARDVFVPVGKFIFLADFVVVDYESDLRVPLIVGRPFLRTARALIDIHGEEMILRDEDERLTLNIKHDTASYSNHPYKESVNLINIFNLLSEEDCLKDLVTNKQSGNPTFSLHKEIASPEVIHEFHDSKGCTFLSEELPDIDSLNDIHPYFDDDPLSGSTTYSANLLLEEFTDELALISYLPDYDDNRPSDIESDIKEIEFLLFLGKDSDFKDSIDQSVLTHYDDLFVDPTPEMFTEEQLLIIHFHRDLTCILMISWKLSSMLLLMILLTPRGRKSKRLNS
nr:hypothetical protein [Tanacetum cinerariifolium]